MLAGERENSTCPSSHLMSYLLTSSFIQGNTCCFEFRLRTEGRNATDGTDIIQLRRVAVFQC